MMDKLPNYLALFSYILIAIGYPKYGFPLNMITSFLFIRYGYHTKQHSFIWCNIIYLIIGVYGCYNWIYLK